MRLLSSTEKFRCCWIEVGCGGKKGLDILLLMYLLSKRSPCPSEFWYAFSFLSWILLLNTQSLTNLLFNIFFWALLQMCECQCKSYDLLRFRTKCYVEGNKWNQRLKNQKEAQNCGAGHTLAVRRNELEGCYGLPMRLMAKGDDFMTFMGFPSEAHWPSFAICGLLHWNLHMPLLNEFYFHWRSSFLCLGAPYFINKILLYDY